MFLNSFKNSFGIHIFTVSDLDITQCLLLGSYALAISEIRAYIVRGNPRSMDMTRSLRKLHSLSAAYLRLKGVLGFLQLLPYHGNIRGSLSQCCGIVRSTSSEGKREAAIG